MSGSKTYACLNGNAWNSFQSAQTQQIYIAAVSEALIREGGLIFEKKYMTPSLTTADVQVLVGSFYATRENLLIPILDALHIVAMKVNGVDLSVIETEILIQRRIAAAAPERTAQR